MIDQQSIKMMQKISNYVTNKHKGLVKVVKTGEEDQAKVIWALKAMKNGSSAEQKTVRAVARHVAGLVTETEEVDQDVQHKIDLEITHLMNEQIRLGNIKIPDPNEYRNFMRSFK